MPPSVPQTIFPLCPSDGGLLSLSDLYIGLVMRAPQWAGIQILANCRGLWKMTNAASCLEASSKGHKIAEVSLRESSYRKFRASWFTFAHFLSHKLKALPEVSLQLRKSNYKSHLANSSPEFLGIRC